MIYLGSHKRKEQDTEEISPGVKRKWNGWVCCQQPQLPGSYWQECPVSLSCRSTQARLHSDHLFLPFVTQKCWLLPSCKWVIGWEHTTWSRLCTGNETGYIEPRTRSLAPRKPSALVHDIRATIIILPHPHISALEYLWNRSHRPFFCSCRCDVPGK